MPPVIPGAPLFNTILFMGCYIAACWWHTFVTLIPKSCHHGTHQKYKILPYLLQFHKCFNTCAQKVIQKTTKIIFGSNILIAPFIPLSCKTVLTDVILWASACYYPHCFFLPCKYPINIFDCVLCHNNSV